jgi:hypothetical protein
MGEAWVGGSEGERFQGFKVSRIVSGFGLRVSSGSVVIATTGIDWVFDRTITF